jgi:glutamate racemase
MSPKESPIGVFDSGIGGLTVVRELRRQLPAESIVYFGDTARVPYGNKSPETVIRYAVEASILLLEYKVKAIVVACNTASAHAVEHLKKKFSIPVFGVIQPGVNRAVEVTESGKVLIIGTSGTVRSNAYQKKLIQAEREIEVFQQPCPLFVPLVEEGWLDNEITFSVIEKYLSPFRKKGIDTIILGCTHYPLLKPAIQQYWPEINLVDSGVETAKMLISELNGELLNGESGKIGSCRFLVSDIAENFVDIGQMFLGTKMEHFQVLDLDHFIMKHQKVLEEKLV